MDYNFDNIAGYETEKEELKKLCDIFTNRKKYENKGASLPKGIIFYGEPGSGKTLFSKVMASVCGLEVFKIDLGDVENESAICRHIKKTFVKAGKRKEPTMIFFDEMDKVLPNYNEKYVTDRSKTILTQLLTLIDGMDSSGNIVFVATCNYYNSLPEALTRPGRLDKKIGIGAPDYDSRVEILKMYTQKSSCKFSMKIEDMAKMTSGFSCSALQTFVNECVLSSDDKGVVSEELIHSKYYEISNEDIPRARVLGDDKICACKNVGCFIVAKSINGGYSTLNLYNEDNLYNSHFDAMLSDCKNDYDDYDDYDDDDECEDKERDVDSVSYYSKVDYCGLISVLLGGYVAQELMFDKVYDNIESNVQAVDGILTKMANCGMFGLSYYFSSDRDSDFPFSSARLAKLNDMFDQIVNECYEKAKTILMKNKDLLTALVLELVKKEILKVEEVEQIIENFGGLK